MEQNIAKRQVFAFSPSQFFVEKNLSNQVCCMQCVYEVQINMQYHIKQHIKICMYTVCKHTYVQTKEKLSMTQPLPPDESSLGCLCTTQVLSLVQANTIGTWLVTHKKVSQRKIVESQRPLVETIPVEPAYLPLS